MGRATELSNNRIELTARIGPILAMQTPEQRRAIEGAIAEGAKKYLTTRGVEISTAVLLAVGQKA